MSKTTLTDGSPVTDNHREIEPKTGQQIGYVVLSGEERAKGYVRPVRYRYRHVGRPEPRNPLRDLTDEETNRYDGMGYAKFESYPDSSPVSGRYWSQAEIDKIDKGCGTITEIALSIAETFARDPAFYGSTFCVGCREHLPLNEFVWDEDGERVGE